MMGPGASAAVIGGGFYGCSIAALLSNMGANVTLFEKEPDLLMRASYNNQARLHGGYHYPRSFSTAYRSRANLPRFLQDYRPAIETSFTNIYAVAKRNSKVSARQFEFLCRQIEAPIRVAADKIQRLFSPQLIACAYVVEEYAFDAAVLRKLMRERLDQAGVKIQCGTAVTRVERVRQGQFELSVGDSSSHAAQYVFNCAYSGLNAIPGLAKTAHTLKHEIAELALVELPPSLSDLSVTVVDGPFFSFVPFPDRKLTTLTHVRYTPHANWIETADQARDPYLVVAEFAPQTRFRSMLYDAQRYMPDLAGARYRESLFDVKTVLVKNEVDDGRPILFEWHPDEPQLVWVLGSKIDNIYDVLSAVEDHIREH
jgi:glycine/D-amino acid oxidase-like deaminating enzyme